MKISWISRKRAARPSIRYSLSPERNRRRVMVTSEGLGGSAGRARSEACSPGSTRVMVTAAIPSGLRSRVPAKMTSSIRAPRRVLADCSPRTQLMASLRFDFPHPFGPTMAAMPPPLKRSSVRSQKDLKPWISTRFSFSKPLPRLSRGMQPY